MLQVPRITRRLELKEYSLDYGELALEVWVNISREHRAEYARVFGEFARAVKAEDVEALKGIAPELTAWWGVVWGTPAEETLEFYHEASTDLWNWCARRSFELMDEWRQERVGPKADCTPGDGDIARSRRSSMSG